MSKLQEEANQVLVDLSAEVLYTQRGLSRDTALERAKNLVILDGALWPMLGKMFEKVEVENGILILTSKPTIHIVIPDPSISGHPGMTKGDLRLDCGKITIKISKDLIVGYPSYVEFYFSNPEFEHGHVYGKRSRTTPGSIYCLGNYKSPEAMFLNNPSEAILHYFSFARFSRHSTKCKGKFADEIENKILGIKSVSKEDSEDDEPGF